MIVALFRSAVAVVLSIVVAMVGIVLVEVVTLALYPFAEGADIADHDVVAAHVAKCPGWVLAIGVVGWGATIFASSWVATRLGAGRHPAFGIVIGALLFSAVLFNMSMLPYSVWFVGANLVMIPLLIFAAVKLGCAPRSAPSEPTAAE